MAQLQIQSAFVERRGGWTVSFSWISETFCKTGQRFNEQQSFAFSWWTWQPQDTYGSGILSCQWNNPGLLSCPLYTQNATVGCGILCTTDDLLQPGGYCMAESSSWKNCDIVSGGIPFRALSSVMLLYLQQWMLMRKLALSHSTHISSLIICLLQLKLLTE